MKKFEIGDRVTGNKTGTMTPATVVGVVTGDHYDKQMNRSGKEKWDREYPEWRDKYVYICEFDDPTPNCTYEEFMDIVRIPPPERVPGRMTSIDAFLYKFQDWDIVTKEMYELTVPRVMSIAYVEDDLVSMEQMNEILLTE